MPRFKIIQLWKPFWLVPALSVLLGFAQVSDKLILAVATLAGLFLIYKHSLDHALRSRLVTIFVGITAYMMAVTAWFRNIEALGWQDIAHLPPQFWLLIAVLIASAFCALVATIWFYIGYEVIRRFKLQKSPLKLAYLWAVSMMVMEIIISTTFSLASKADGATVEPTWNMYSVALMTASNVLGGVSRFTGLWGTSFVLYAASALLGLIACAALRRKLPGPRVLAVTAALLLGVITMTLVRLPSRPGDEIRVIAVSEPVSDARYLEKLQHTIKSDLNDQPDIPRIVVLPEYSNLLSPYANTSILTFNYDARYRYPELFRDTGIYFVGTEDQYLDGRRYAENYVVNGNLEKIKRRPKTFLIPGGEYVVGWVGSILSIVNKDAATNFKDTRVRSVIHEIPGPQTADRISEVMGIGACSSILVPYTFREQAANGAGFFAVNVSYEQFRQAPEYQQFANRFARFIARSTARPLAIGAFAGPAALYDASGNRVVDSNDGTAISKTIRSEHAKTPYTVLGDTAIVFLLSSPLLIVLVIKLSRKIIGFLRTVKL
jgi:apolipoprotein N-acyltransferase